MTPSDDLVRRLRETSDEAHYADCAEAADRIEQLEADVADAQKAIDQLTEGWKGRATEADKWRAQVVMLGKLLADGDIDPIHETPPSTRDALPEREKSVSADARDAGFVKPDNDRQVFFYERDFYVLSNFSAFSINWQGRIFPTSEHAYHWEKFLLGVKDGTVFVRDAILGAVSAHEAFKMAERWKPLRREDWGLRKVDVMREILRAKVDQHEYVKRKLLATGDRELIEDSWRDDFWGWGANRTGQNMLGKLWMEIRRELKDAAMEKK